MKNTDFMNLSLPEGTDKIDIEILNSDFTAIENLLKQHAIIETMTLNGEGVIIGAIGPYIRLQNIDTVQVSIDIGKETYTLASGENMIIRETAENIGIITSGNVHITYFVNSKTYADKEFYSKKKVDELLSKVEGNVEVDAELSETSENPVQNKVINAKFKEYYNSEEVNELIDGIGTPEDVYTKTETDNLLSTKANKSNTYTKTETDNKITEKVSEIVSGAPEDFDTLKEMSDWLTEHEDSAASMNSAIQKNAEDIVTANTNIAKKLDKTTRYAISDEVGGAASTVKTTITSVDADRVVYFGDSTNGLKGGATKTGVDSAFYYNPVSKRLNVKNIVSDTTNNLINQALINKTSLGVQCKNLLECTGATQTKQGITFTVNEDKSITVSGANTGETNIWFRINGENGVLMDIFEVGKTYTLSGAPSDVLDNNGKQSAYLQVEKPSKIIKSATPGEPVKFTVTEGNEPEYITIRITADADYTNKPITFYPMIQDASITDTTYEPYQPSLQEQLTALVEGLNTWTSRGIANVSYLPAEGVTQKLNKTLRRVILDVSGSLLLGVEANTAISLGNLTSNTYIPASSPRVAVTSNNTVIGYVVKNATNVSVAFIAVSKIEAGTTISARLEWTY